MTKKNKLPIAKTPIPVKVVSSPPCEIDDMKWKVEDALRTIQKAEEFKKDGKLMNRVETLAKEQMSALKKICK